MRVAEEPLVRLVAGVFRYGEVRGADTMARWLEEARAGEAPRSAGDGFVGFLERQVEDERRHAELWAAWLARRGFASLPGGAAPAGAAPGRRPPPGPPRSIVRLMDWQDAAQTWAERFATTHLTIEALSLHLYAALRDRVDPDTRQVLAAIHADEGRHVGAGADFARRFLDGDPDGLRAARRAVSRAMRLNLQTAGATAPLISALGVDVRRLAGATWRAVPRRLLGVGVAPPWWTAVLALAARRTGAGTS